MVLTCAPFQAKCKNFKFEAFWLNMPEVKELVQQSWTALVNSSNKARVLHIKLARLGKALKIWNRQ
jgi:hypothetical protein